jgi:hypothetical protein
MSLPVSAGTSAAGTAVVEDAPVGRLQGLARLQALQIVLLLAVTVGIFTAMEPDTFLTPFNLRGIVQNTGDLRRAGRRHDVRHHHGRHRPVDRQRPGVQRRRRLQGDGLAGR